MKRLFFIILSLLLLGGINAQTTWNCGTPIATDVTATLSNDTLYISGTGAMQNFSYPPWDSNSNAITTVVINNGVTNIGAFAFINCSNLTSIVIPNSVTSIGNSAFLDCSNLSSITIPSVTSIGEYAFDRCSSLTSIVIPNSVTSIGEYAFWYCSNLTAIVIPNSITSIREGAFADCGFTSIVIPASVTSIEDVAFAYCNSLTTVTNFNPVPQNISSNVFYNVNDTLIVPCGSLLAYKNAAVWKDFATIMEDCPRVGISKVKATFACPGGVTVTYNLNTTQPTDATLYYSHNKRDWLVAETVTGDLTDQSTGTNKSITWDCYADKVRFGKFYFKIEVPLPPEPECVEINGVCWATRNVGAPGTFVENPEDTGMYYQWNRNVGWSATDPMENSNGGTTWDSSMPIGTTWEKANDPSPAGFRVPTLEELEKLCDETKVDYEWKIENGIAGGKFTDKTNGNSIFLPVVSFRYYSNGTLTSANSYGSYWSSSQYDSSIAFFLLFGSGYAGGWHPNNRSYGFSVRCVAE